MVELSPHKPKSKGLNPATITGREKVEKILIYFEKSISCGNTVTELLTHEPKSEGLKPIADSGREKMAKSCIDFEINAQ